MSRRTIPTTRVRIEAVAAETRGGFTAQVFSIHYGSATSFPRDAVLVLVPARQPASRTVRVFFGTPERSGAEEAIASLCSLERTETDDANAFAAELTK